jgi:short-subunit dehydrogenase
MAFAKTTNGKRPRALVTGASSGIGQAFVERLAKYGYDLIIVARRLDRLDALAGRLRASGIAVEVMAADLTDRAGLNWIEAYIRDDALAMLVNNAGFGGYGPFLELDSNLAERQIQLHLTALVRLTRAALPGMVARKSGAVISVSSMLAFSGNIRMERPKRATYAASKAFINTFTQALAQELEGTGVRVQALCPSLVRTEFHDALGGRPPGVPVIEPDDIVRASLAGLALGEVICAPTLPDASAIARLAEAEAALFGQGRAPAVAERYGAPERS